MTPTNKKRYGKKQSKKFQQKIVLSHLETFLFASFISSDKAFRSSSPFVYLQAFVVFVQTSMLRVNDGSKHF